MPAVFRVVKLSSTYLVVLTCHQGGCALRRAFPKGLRHFQSQFATEEVPRADLAANRGGGHLSARQPAGCS